MIRRIIDSRPWLWEGRIPTFKPAGFHSPDHWHELI